MSHPTTPARLDALTGLRFLAALLVVLYHLAPPYLRGAPQWLQHLVGGGYVGVGLFFLLSGFILAYNYLPALQAGRLRPGAFYRARFARVYPVYLLGLLLAAPFVFERFTQRAGSWAAALPSLGGLGAAVLSLTQAWMPTRACAWNCPGWSLSAEAFFYLIFPFAGALLLRLRPRRQAPAALALYLAALLPPLLYLALAPDGVRATTPHTDAYWLVALKFNPLLRLPEFLLGVWLGQRFLQRAAPPAETLPRRHARRGAAALPLLALLGIGAALAAGPALPYPLLHNGLLAPLFALLVFGLGGGAGALARLLAHPRLARLGEASYALYILHLPLWTLLERAARAAGLRDLASPAYLIAYLAIALAASLATLRWVEEPARRWLRPRPASPRPAAPGAAEAAARRAA